MVFNGRKKKEKHRGQNRDAFFLQVGLQPDSRVGNEALVGLKPDLQQQQRMPLGKNGVIHPLRSCAECHSENLSTGVFFNGVPSPFSHSTL